MILAICGSLQRTSSNLALLRAAGTAAPPGTVYQIFEGLAALPAFNPDDEPGPASVLAWREALRAAQGVLISTPEYAHGMPGALKNALDWVVGSGELVGKPTVLVSASPGATGGVRAQVQLVQVLSAMDVPVIETFTVPLVRGKLGPDGEVRDAATLKRLADALSALARAAD
ncbi:MAG: flavoprotein [Cyanobacteria bacterium RYN_339]|nr:flavoprotein [Cyanobacteria bacterium RYN_339]